MWFPKNSCLSIFPPLAQVGDTSWSDKLTGFYEQAQEEAKMIAEQYKELQKETKEVWTKYGFVPEKGQDMFEFFWTEKVCKWIPMLDDTAAKVRKYIEKEAKEEKRRREAEKKAAKKKKKAEG